MDYKLGFVLLCLLLTDGASGQSKHTGKCSYFGEPHLLPFPTTPGQTVNQYVCRPGEPEVLVKNKLLTIEVTTSTSGNHPIVEYTVIINPVPGYSQSCIISDSTTNPSNSLSCPSGSPAVTVLAGTSLYIQHLTQNILISIDNFGYFDITVNLPFDLIAKSKGVCVKWDCDLEIDNINGRRRRANDYVVNSYARDICNAFVTAADKQVDSQADSLVLKSRMTACIYDISMTGNAQFARSVTNAITRSSIEQYADDSDYLRRLLKADTQGQQSFCETTALANEIIAKSREECYDKAEGTQCLRPIDVSKFCG